MTKFDEIQKAGANARALGFSELTSPYYRAENLPGATGESVAEWQAKADAWELGWKMEDAIRGGC